MTENEFIDKKLKKFRTDCCNDEFYKKGRADLRCKKCDKDVTLEIVLITEGLIFDYKSVKNDFN